MADELGVAEQVYGLAGEPLTDDARAAMTDYLAGHQRGRLGRVATSSEMFGLDEDELRERVRAVRQPVLVVASHGNRAAGLARLLHQDRRQADGRQDRDGDRESLTGRLQSPPLGGQALTDDRQRDRHIRDDEVGRS